MILDIICLLGILLFLVWGLLSGFLQQVVRLVALLGAFLLVTPVAGWMRAGLSGLGDVDRFPGNMLLLLLAWLVGYLVLLGAGLILLRVVRGVASSISGPDRALGGLFGMLKGGVIVYGLVTFVLLFQDPLTNLLPEAARELRRSRVVAIVNMHNPLLDWMRDFQERIRSRDRRLTLRDRTREGESAGCKAERSGSCGSAGIETIRGA